MLQTNERLKEEATTLPFERHDDELIYYVNPEHGHRLCIPDYDELIKQVFQQVHDELGYPGYHRSHERLTQGLYTHRLSPKLHDYLRHCPVCQLNQTPRHRPYGNLQTIITPPTPFYIITIDFILALPQTKDGFNTALSITDKFSKRITFVVGKNIWRANNWARGLLQQLDVTRWSLPKIILSDRDPKFLSALWKEIFKTLKVNLLYSTAYHLQTDGSSERTNQTAEIALRFYLAESSATDEWPTILPHLQAALNNATSAPTGKSPNEVICGFRLRKPLDLATTSDQQPPLDVESLTALGTAAWVDMRDSIAFAAMTMKDIYDTHHQ